MVMDTRTTNLLNMYSQSQVFIVPASTLVRPTRPYGVVTIRHEMGAMGRYKQIVSERDGRFFPGKFRANPCKITECEVEKISGYARTNAYLGNHVEIIGDLWNIPVNVGTNPWIYNGAEYNSGYGKWVQSYADMAKVKAMSKLKEAEFDAGVALGELKETLDLLRNPFAALTAQFTKMLREKRKPKHKRKGVNQTEGVLDILAGSWLTYRYGMIPIMSDIQSIIQLCERKVRKIEGMQRKSGGDEVIRSDWKIKSDLLVSVGVPSMYLTALFEFKRTYKTIHHCYYLRDFESAEENMMRILGLHPVQFTNFLYETTRLSFVLDWFVAVGDWLRAFTPDPRISFSGNCVSQKISTEMRATVTRIASPVGLDPTQPVVLPSFTAKSSFLERRVATAEVVMPPFNPNFFTVKRLLDSLSLVWALLPRRKH